MRMMLRSRRNWKTKEIEHSIIKTFRKAVCLRLFTKALNEYQLIQEGDKIAVCILRYKDHAGWRSCQSQKLVMGRSI